MTAPKPHLRRTARGGWVASLTLHGETWYACGAAAGEAYRTLITYVRGRIGDAQRAPAETPPEEPAA